MFLLHWLLKFFGAFLSTFPVTQTVATPARSRLGLLCQNSFKLADAKVAYHALSVLTLCLSK